MTDANWNMWFGAKNGVIREYITPLRAYQIAGITSDFKMDKLKWKLHQLDTINLLRHNSIIPLSLKTISFSRKVLLRVWKYFNRDRRKLEI